MNLHLCSIRLRISRKIIFMPLPEKRHLDTSNPEHLVYHHGLLEIAVLGGIRTDILDRMRVMLKIKVEPKLAQVYTLCLFMTPRVCNLVHR